MMTDSLSAIKVPPPTQPFEIGGLKFPSLALSTEDNEPELGALLVFYTFSESIASNAQSDTCQDY
jgi:hypothetical protein